MIYNLLQYLRDSFPALVANPDAQITNAIDVSLTDEVILVRDNGGPQEGYPDNRADASIQIITYARSDFRAYELSDTIYQYLIDRHDVTLPAADGTNSPAPETLRINRIHAMQRPFRFDPDDNGLFRYANNYLVTFSDGVLVN